MMLDADHLRIVFSVSGVSFVMPVVDLLAIRSTGEDDLVPLVQSSGLFQLGSLVYRETEVTVYDLAALFELAGNDQRDEGHLLVFAGSDCPWAVSVDRVAGVVDAAQFEFRDLPSHLFRDESVPYHQVASHDGKLFISVDAQQIGRAWRRSG
jgi:chemotaxis signal transduction protein